MRTYPVVIAIVGAMVLLVALLSSPLFLTAGLDAQERIAPGAEVYRMRSGGNCIYVTGAGHVAVVPVGHAGC